MTVRDRVMNVLQEWQGWVWPATVTNISGYNFTATHHGIDIGTPLGSDILAPASGVATVENDPSGYGLYVSIITDDGHHVILGHLSKAFVSDGDKVGPGDVVGAAGSSGNSTGPHLHFEVRTKGDGAYIDPWTIYGNSPEPGEPGDIGSGKITYPGDGQTLPIGKSLIGDEDSPVAIVGDPLSGYALKLNINWTNILVVFVGLVLLVIGVAMFAGNQIIGQGAEKVAAAIKIAGVE